MATLAKLNVILGLTSKDFTKGIDKARRKLKYFGRDMDRLGRSMVSGLTVPVLAAGTAAVKMAVDFETSMTKIISLVGVSEKQVKEWSTLLLKLGPELGKTPGELAEALFYVTSAGYRGAEAIDVLVNAAKASQVGLGTTADVADAVTSAVTAYGAENLNAAKATSILLAAVREGKAGAEAIAPVLGNVIGVAAEMGVEFHEVAAAIAAMTRTGVPAEVTVTNLSAILSTLQKGSIKTRKGLIGVGTSLDAVRATLKEKGLIGLLSDLKDKFGENEDAAAQVFGNVRALRGLFGLVGRSAEDNIGIFARLADETENGLGKAFDITATKSAFKFSQILSTISVAAVTLGNAIVPVVLPALQQFGAYIADLTAKFQELDPRFQRLAILAAAIAAALGPVLIILGLMASGLALISAKMILFTAAVGGGAVLLAKNWTTVKTALAAFIDFARPALEGLKTLALEVFARIKEFALAVWPAIQEIVGKTVAAISAFWKEHGETIMRYVRRAWSVVRLIILGTLEAILGTVEAFIHVLNGDWPKALDTLKTSAVRVFDTIGRVIRASLIRSKAGFFDFAAGAGQALARILGKIRSLVVAWMEVPFINPVAKVAGAAALDAIDLALGGIVVAATSAKLEAQALNKAADALLKPVQNAEAGVKQYQSAWVTAKVVGQDAVESTKISITRAGEEIKDTLKGGFGKGVEEGAEDAKKTYNDLSEWVKDHPLRPVIDMEFVQRQLAELDLAPDTGGGLP